MPDIGERRARINPALASAIVVEQQANESGCDHRLLRGWLRTSTSRWRSRTAPKLKSSKSVSSCSTMRSLRAPGWLSVLSDPGSFCGSG